MLAAGAGDRPLIERLVAAGANIDQQNNNGACPLEYAAAAGHIDVVRQLLAAGANPSLNNNSALRVARQQGFDEIARLISDAASR